MEVIYFYEHPKLNGYDFHQLTNFKHGVEFSFFNDSHDWDKEWRKMLIPLILSLTETYGDNSNRYELLLNQENSMYRVYFKDDTDQVAFKLLWPGEWDPDPVWGDEEDE